MQSFCNPHPRICVVVVVVLILERKEGGREDHRKNIDRLPSVCPGWEIEPVS